MNTFPADPIEAIRGFTKLVRRLPRNAAMVWARATKEFDVGVQAGFERRSGEWVLEPDVVKIVADWGGHLRLTVYSPLLVIREESAAKRRAGRGPTA